MNYIILDLEFNSYFKFDGNDGRNRSLRDEIVQIGALKLNENFEVITFFDMLIKPSVYERMNPYVKKITRIRTRHLKSGLSFEEAINQFTDWLGDNYILCSWGTVDIQALMENCRFYGCSCPHTDKAIDIQRAYAEHYNLSQLPRLRDAVGNMGMNAPLQFHMAVNDAIYTYAVLLALLKSATCLEAIDFEALLMRDIKRQIRLVKRIYQLKKLYIRCPKCGRFATRVRKQFTSKSKPTYKYLYGICPSCNIEITYVVKIKKTDGRFSQFIKQIEINHLTLKKVVT